MIHTIAGNGTPGYSEGGQVATAAQLNQPMGLALDAAGNLYIADYANHVVRRVDPAGHISTVAGNNTLGPGYSGDNATATDAQLNQPAGLAIDSSGNLFIADSGNHVIRKVDSSHNIITVAGLCAAPPCSGGFGGDNGPATSALLNTPMAVAVDGASNLYIADYGNHRIRRIDNGTGNITTIAGDGTADYSGEGGAATAARLNHPSAVLRDTAGVLYIADRDNDVVRRIDTLGNISTVAGNHSPGFSGDGGAATSAKLSGPIALAIDKAGDLYIADHYNNVLRRVDIHGVITTVAGNAAAASGYAGDNGPATGAKMNGPHGVVIDSDGVLYTADLHNNVVREVDVTAAILGFGPLPVGQTSPSKKIAISNVGSSPLNFSQPFSVTSNFQLQTVGGDCAAGTPVLSGETCLLGIAFAPTISGSSLTGSVSVADDGVGGPHLIALTGSTTEGPTITSSATATFTVGTNGTFNVTTSGSPAPAISQSGTLPSGVTFVDNGDGTGTLSGTSAAGTGGTYALTFTAQNGTAPDGTQNFTLTVNQAPSITSANSASFQAGSSGSFTVITSGFPVTTITELGTLPAGVTFTDNLDGTGTLAGTPTSGGTFSISFSAANGVSPNASQSFTLNVGQGPAITSANNTTFKVSSAGSFTVNASGSPSPSISVSGSLPFGVTFVDNGNGSAKLSGTPAANTGGVYPLNLTAQNGNLPNGTQNFTLTVNQAPAITSANSTSFAIGAAGSFIVTTTGFPKAAITQSGTLPAGITLTDNRDGTARLSGTPTAGGVFNITISANNTVTPNASQSFTITIPQSPAITSPASTSFKVGSAGSFTITTTGSPASTLSLTGTLPTGVTFTNNSNGTAKLSGTPAAGSGGTYALTITAQNGTAPNATQNFVLTVSQAPAFTSVAGATVAKGSPLSYTITASGFPLPAITRSGSLPAGVTFTDNRNGTGTLAGTPTASGVFTSTFSASNGTTPNASQSFAITVTQSPAITSTNKTAFKVGSSGSFTVNTTGTPTAVITASGALPVGVTFVASGSSAKLSGTPAAGSAGTYPLVITAQNGTAPNAVQNFTLTVNQVPAITSAASTIFHTKSAGSFTFVATGFPVPALTKSGTLPSGVTFTDNHNGTATLSGTASANATATLQITANNGISPNATQSFTFTASPGPAITSVASTAFKVGTAGTFNITTAGSPAPTITESGALPSGVTFVNNGNGTAKLSGTPAAGTSGSYRLTLTAQNGTTPNATQTFTLTVNQSPAFSSTGSATFQAASAGSFTVTTTGLPAPALTSSGSLPSGVTFTDNRNGTATISGTSASTGTFPLTLTATNSVGSATQSFSLTVGQGLGISSANNATFATTAPSTFTVTATGTPLPSISVNGTLPPGLAFIDNRNGSGTLSGTATTGGVYTFSFVAGNSSGSSSQNFTLTVNQPPTISSANTASFAVGTAASFTVRTTGYPAPALTQSGALPAGMAFIDNRNGMGTLSGTPTDVGTFPISLTATSSLGIATQSFTLTTTAAAQPISVRTNISGLSFVVDGTTYATPQTFSWAPGTSHTLSTVSPQTQYTFSGWSDGGAISHPIVAPATATTYTAIFTAPIASSPECTGYAQPRIFLEAQAWWVSDGTGTNYGMVSEGTCFPVGATLTGVVPFDVRVVLYDAPGVLQTVETQLFGKKDGLVPSKLSNLNISCPEEECVYWFHMDVDTAQYPSDGLQEFRFHAIRQEIDGKQTFPSTGWQAYLLNGRPVQDYRSTPNFVEGRGWYTDEEYSNARLDSPIPTQPLSGTWSFNVTIAPGSGGKPVTGHLVAVDFCSTCDDAVPAMTVKSGTGKYVGPISLDTRQLPNGTHYLYLRSYSKSTAGSTLSGAMVIPFVVAN
jgi:sugar lactone lactonase YvrE